MSCFIGIIINPVHHHHHHHQQQQQHHQQQPPQQQQADDLGYGDLSVAPFTGTPGHYTPSLERMAQNSVLLTNFRVAAPVCTPSRASQLTGLFPYRLGITFIFGSGELKNEYLSVVPNAPYLFSDAGYHTGTHLYHSTHHHVMFYRNHH
jgi:arylsulfatase A-like enzyme